MPRLMLGDPPVTPTTPGVHPKVDLAAYAETSWLACRLDAQHVIEHLTRAHTIDTRIAQGYEWLETHPDDMTAQWHLWRLQDRASASYATARMWMKSAWLHAVETFGFRRNAGLPSDEPPDLWRQAGLGDLSPPGSWPPEPGEKLHWLDMKRPSISGWALADFQAVANTVRTHAGGGEGRG